MLQKIFRRLRVPVDISFIFIIHPQLGWEQSSHLHIFGKKTFFTGIKVCLFNRVFGKRSGKNNIWFPLHLTSFFFFFQALVRTLSSSFKSSSQTIIALLAPFWSTHIPNLLYLLYKYGIFNDTKTCERWK